MNQPPTPLLARRSAIALAMTGALSALTACGDDSKPAKANASGTGSASSSASAPKISPVDGFSPTPTWSSTQVGDIAALVPMKQAGAVWHEGHAWFLLSTGTESASVRIVALDPKKTAVSAVVDKKLTSGTRTQWVTITHPSPALVVDTGTFGEGSVLVKLSGDAITTTPLPAPPNGGQPVWMGDVIVAPSSDDGAAGSLYDPAKNTYTPLTPQHGGRIIGASVNGGKVAPVELTSGSPDKPQTRVYANGRDASSGIAGDGGQDRAIHAMAWTTNGSIVLSVEGPSNGAIVYAPYSAALKPATTGAYPNASNPDSFEDDNNSQQPQAISSDRRQAIIANGLAYDATANRVTRGVWTPNSTMTWDLSNAAITASHLCGNASDANHDASLPTTGAYTSTTGALTPQNQAGKTAPALVLPSGDGLFLTEVAQLRPKA